MIIKDTTRTEFAKIASLMTTGTQNYQRTQNLLKNKRDADLYLWGKEIIAENRIRLSPQTLKHKFKEYVKILDQFVVIEDSVEVKPKTEKITKVVVHYENYEICYAAEQSYYPTLLKEVIPDGFVANHGQVGVDDVPKVKLPEYSMFCESEDGYLVLKGSYKGKYIQEIDELNFKGCARGWAQWCLKNDKDLTDGDRTVFGKIIFNKF